MRRLLTGYAVSFNQRHRWLGQLFQNRYKSILCEEEPYLLELVRYIHLNPLRARLVADMKSLDSYPYSGHAVLIGKIKNDWQDAGYILAHFGKQLSAARRRYQDFVQDSAPLGKRPELNGGGLISSLGGWKAVKNQPAGMDRMKGDERILGSNDFVEKILLDAEEQLDRREQLKAMGYDLDALVRKVAELFAVEPSRIFTAGKYP